MYYIFGGSYADIVTKYLPGYEVHAEPTSASVDNVIRLDTGDMEIAMGQADIAVDGIFGRSAFAGQPRRLVALARTYDEIVQVVVRSDAKIRTLADLRGKRVSTGSPNSGSESTAIKLLQAAGLQPDTDVTRVRLSLGETAKGMIAGTIDALVFVGGLPTPGLTDLLTANPGKFTLLPVASVLDALAKEYGELYTPVQLGKAVYGTPTDIATMGVPNLLMVHPDMPEKLAYDLTRLLFEHQQELAAAHPAGGRFDRANGPRTEPVPLHPGARRFYEQSTTK